MNGQQRTSIYRGLLVSSLLTTSLHAQAPAGSTARIEAVGHLGQRIDSALADPRYNGLNPVEKRLVAYLALNAMMMVETGQCADLSAPGSAAESFLYTFTALSRGSLKPVFELPAARKTDLVDSAVELASQQAPDADLTERICDGRLLPASSVKPVAERREGARYVLMLGLSQPPSNSPTPHAQPPGDHSEPSSVQQGASRP